MMVEMVEMVEDRLKMLGYEITDDERASLPLLIQRVEFEIKNSCNIESVPVGLVPVHVDMVAGEFLFNQMMTGQLKDFDTDAAVKQIKEGDTSVTYALGEGSTTPEQKLNGLIHHLLHHGRSQFVAYRRLSW